MKYKIITLIKKDIKDFANEKNILIKKSDSEWILFLDSDEKPDPILKKMIDQLSSHTEVKSYFVTRRNFFLNQYVGRDKIIRLIKKGSGFWKRAVHETYKTKYPVGEVDGYIIHDTAYHLSKYLEKINKYSSMHAIENKKEGKSSNVVKIIFFPFSKFLITYAKSRHVVFSIMQSFHSFLSWSKQYLEKK